jgi:hypothetical protein
MTRAGIIAGALALAIGLSACAKREAPVLFDGYAFKAKLSKAREDKRDFVVTVENAGQSLDGAREAGRYEATKYCMNTRGSSDIDWTAGPDDAEDALQVTDGILTFAGRCIG